MSVREITYLPPRCARCRLVIAWNRDKPHAGGEFVCCNCGGPYFLDIKWKDGYRWTQLPPTSRWSYRHRWHELVEALGQKYDAERIAKDLEDLKGLTP